MILFLLAIFSLVVGIILHNSGNRIFNIDDYQNKFEGAFIPGILLLAVFCLVWVFVYPDSISTYSQVTAFADAKIYEDYTAIIQQEVDAGVIGDISNGQVGSLIVQDIQKWYRNIEWANQKIKKYKTLNDNPFTNWFVYDWPEYPDLITKDDIRKMDRNIRKKVDNMGIVPLINVGK